MTRRTKEFVWEYLLGGCSSRHLHSAKNLHCLDSADLCIFHPEESSQRVITRSTRRNSHRFHIAGFQRALCVLSKQANIGINFKCYMSDNVKMLRTN